jgi:hypothetical protein
MSGELQVPFEFYTVTLRGEGQAGTTLPDHIPGDPLIVRPDGLLAGHAGEWDPDSLLMRATFERVGAIALDVPTNCGEYHVEEGAVFPDVDFQPVATHPCTLVGNQPPDAIDDSDVTLAGVPVTIDVQANDSDPDNDPLSTIAATPGEHGLAVVELDGSVTYVPQQSFGATGDRFEYTIADGTGNSDTATVFVPEPARGVLLASGFGALALLAVRRRR